MLGRIPAAGEGTLECYLPPTPARANSRISSPMSRGQADMHMLSCACSLKAETEARQAARLHTAKGEDLDSSWGC